MENLFFEFLIILLLLLLNGVFAMSEIAVISASKAKLRALEKKGNHKASVALRLSETPNLFLSTIQIGITLIGIIAGVYGGVAFAEELSKYLALINFINPHQDTISYIIIVLFITYLSLILGELVPKRLALNKPDKIVLKVAVPLKTMSFISSPLIKFLSISTEIMLKILGAKSDKDKSVYDDDVIYLMEEGLKTGTFEKNEKEIIEKTLKLSDKSVRTIMTHGTDIVFIDESKTTEEIINIIRENPHARYPVYSGNIDNIIGTVDTIKFFDKLIENEELNLKSIINEPLIIDQDKPVFEVLDTFRRKSINIAVVGNKFGETVGLITDGDILESLVGDIVDKKEPLFIEREDGSFLIDCMMEIDNFKEIFKFTKLPVNEANINTVGGFISTYFGIIPATGEFFIWGGYKFEVVVMDRRRIDKILVSRIM